MAEEKLPPIPAASQHIVGELTKFYNQETLSDFAITSGNRKWNVHRLVLSMYSNVLTSACIKAWKESEEHKIDLSEDDQVCVETLIYYLYHLNYDTRFVNCFANPLAFHVDMCILADKYNIPPLQALAIGNFNKQEYVIGIDKVLAEAAVRAYDAPGPTDAIRKHIVKLAVGSDLLSSPSNINFKNALGTCIGLAADILVAQQYRLQSLERKTMTGENRYRCPYTSCDVTFVCYMQKGDTEYYCTTCGEGMCETGWRKQIVEWD